MSRRALLLLLGLIVLADLAQPATQPWQPRFLAALGGAAIYALAGWGVWRGHRAALALVVGMPLVPVATLTLWAMGVDVPVAPHAAMVGIAALQVAAGAVALVAWRRPRPAT